MIKKIALVITTFMLLSTVAIPFAGDSLVPTAVPAQAQETVDSDDLAKFVAVMQYIRSQPTPADVKAANIPFLTTLDNSLSDIYITGFITPYTGETADQVKARLQSVPADDRFTAVMVESYRLTSNPLLLDIIHQLLPLYYVEFFTTAADLNASAEFLKRADIQSRADGFDSSRYAMPAPSATQTPGGTSPSTRTASDVDSDDLAKFVAIMQYIRSQPTPADVKAINILFLATLDTSLSDIYITGFITPYTGETADQVKARLQSVPTDDRFTAVMVESYRLTSNPLLLDIIHQLLPLYYVEFFTTAEDLDASAEFLKRADIENLADGFDSADYAIPAPSSTPATATSTPSATPVSTATPTIAELVRNVQGGVVQIIALTGSGSGFIIDADGRVVTNQHVVSGNRSVTVRMHDGTEYQASVLGVDAVADLAVVDIAPEIAFPYVPLGDSSLVQVGEEVIAIGYPLGFQLGQSQTVTDGIISARRPNFQGSGVEHLQTNAAINPGNSGGPLFNRAGEVIGVNTSRRETTSDGRPVIGISFAVSINEVKARLTTLTGSGSPQPVTTPTPTPVTPVPTPSAVPTPRPLPLGWNRYNNGVYGFSVDIPPRWTVDADTEELYFAFFRAPDRKASVAIKAYDLPASYSLQSLVEWRRNWLTNYARDNSWNVFEITSFSRKREGVKEFYELAYREQESTEFCVVRVTERIYISSWYPGKPHGYRVGTRVCEHSLNRYSANARVIQNSFTEWMPYWNAVYAFGLNVAPGWTLEKSTEADDYAAFWAPDDAGIIEIEVYEVSPASTVEDFANWRIDVLNRLADSWQVFEPTGNFGFGGIPGARSGYFITYVAQTDSEYCISGNVELMVLSSYHPEHSYGFLVLTAVCEHSLELYNDDRWEMLWGFRY